MKTKIDEITIDGQVYVPKSEHEPAKPNIDGLRYCVIRTYSAGVHIGWIKDASNNHKMISLLKSRRLYYWVGACSLSQVAMDGVDPEASRIAMELPEIILTEAIEIIPCSEKAAKFFQEAPVWKI